MRTPSLIALTTLLAVSLAYTEPSLAAAPYETDDYGFPVEQATAKQRELYKTNRYWRHRAAARALSHASDYNRGVYRHTRNAAKITPSFVKEDSDLLAGSLARAQRELKASTPEHRGDAATTDAIRSISDHLARAQACHEELDAECCKATVDGSVTMRCCGELAAHLRKAIDEHAALMRALEGEQPIEKSGSTDG